MRVVIDTNVLVSAAINPTGTPGRVVARVFDSGRLLITEATVEELDEVLKRPRIARRLPEARRKAALARVILTGELVDVTERIVACRDRDDDKLLELAVNGSATHLVTGDLDLLALHPFRGVPVVTPADFLALTDPPPAG